MSFRRPRFPHQSAYLDHVSELTGSEEFGIGFEKKVQVTDQIPPPKPEREQNFECRHPVESNHYHHHHPQNQNQNPNQRRKEKAEDSTDIEMTGYGFLGSERGVDIGVGAGLELELESELDVERMRQERYRNNNYDEIDYSQSQSQRNNNHEQDLEGERAGSPDFDLPRYRDGDTPGSFERINITCATLAVIPEESSNSNSNNAATAAALKFQEDDHDEHFKWWEIILYTFLVVGFVILSSFYGVWMNTRLPLPKSKSNFGNFNEDRALVDLINLTKDGPRPFGSPEHDKTPAKIIQILKQIKEKMTEINNSLNDVELSWVLDYQIQSSSGSSGSGRSRSRSSDSTANSRIIYRDVKNVVVRLDPRDPSIRSNQSILVNCHYDSAVGSPGAGDDMSSCSIMLEIIRVLSRGTETRARVNNSENDMKNSIVFLFNAEGNEDFLGLGTFLNGNEANQNQNQNQGHNWSKDVKVFLNLQGMGNGRSLLFRTSEQSCQLVDIFTKVAPHPHSLVLAELIFESRFFPLDTEFSMVQNMTAPSYGIQGVQGVQGLELVFYQNGWKHDTKLDDASIFLKAPGSLTHMGENALALLKNLVSLGIGIGLDAEMNVDSTTNETNSNVNVKGHDAWTCFGDQTGVIYYDVFGLFQISYGTKMAFILHLIVGLLFIGVYFLEGCVKGFPSLEQVYSSLFFVPMALGAIGLIVGFSFNLLHYYKPWFSHPSLVFLLYAPPCILTHLMVLSWTKIHIFGKTSGGWSRLRFPLTVSWLSGKLPMVFLLFLGLFWTSGIRLGFPMMIILVFPLFSCGLNRIVFCKVPAVYRCRIERMMNLLLGELPPFFYLIYLSIVIVEMIVPISGRISGYDWNIVMGVVVAVICFFLFHGLAPFLHFFLIWTKKSRFVLAALLFLNVVVINPILIRCLLPSGQIVYGEETPMALEIQNVNRALYHFHNNGHRLGYERRMVKNSSGFALTSPDSNAMYFLDQMKVWNPQLDDLSQSQFQSEMNLESYRVTDRKQRETPDIIKWFPRENNIAEENAIVTMTTKMTGENSRNVTFTFKPWPKMDVEFLLEKDWTLDKWNYKTSSFFSLDLDLDLHLEPKEKQTEHLISNSSCFYSVKVRNGHQFSGENSKFNISMQLQKNSRSRSTSESPEKSRVHERGQKSININWEDAEESFMIQLVIKAADSNTKSPERKSRKTPDSFLQNFPKWINIKWTTRIVQKYIVF